MQRRPKHFYTFEEVSEIAQGYDTRTAFAKGDKNAYDAARRKNWLETVCAHMPPSRRWTYERVAELAQQCSTRTELRDASQYAYIVALNSDWLDIFFPPKIERAKPSNSDECKYTQIWLNK